MGFLEFLLINSSTKGDFASTGSCVLNMLGAIILIGALIPPFLDTVRSRKTFGISDKFFFYSCCGGACMWINAVCGIIEQATGTKDVKLFVLFSIFLVVNTVSVCLNSYMWKIKKQNMAAAAEMSMSEQDYYENVLKQQFELA